MDIKNTYSIYWKSIAESSTGTNISNQKDFDKEAEADSYFNSELQKFGSLIASKEVKESTMFLVFDDKNYKPLIVTAGDDAKTKEINSHRKVACNSVWRKQSTGVQMAGVDLYVDGLPNKFYQIKDQKLVDVTENVRL